VTASRPNSSSVGVWSESRIAHRASRRSARALGRPALTRSLQRFADRIARHPVLQRAKIVQDFLTSTEWVR
jgi:hypothetical protein